MWKLSDQDIQALIGQFERSDWREMRLRMKGYELLLAKDAAPQYHEVTAEIDEIVSSERPNPSPSTQSKPVKEAPDEVPPGWQQICAPSLGSFYRAAKPGEHAFVEPGSQVNSDTEVCMIEVMKLFTTVRAGINGVIRKVYPKDAQLVEFNEPLFLVEPNV